MSEPIEIPPGGGNRLHVFNLGLSDEEAAAFVERPANDGPGWPLKVALHADHLDPEHIEHFPVDALEGLGLATYLTEGLGADPEAVAEMRDRLDTLRGEVVILRPRAFAGQAQTLTPAPPLAHVGSFPEAQPETTMERLHTPSARGAGPAAAPPPAAGNSRAIKWLSALAALIIVAGALLVLSGALN